MSQKRVVSLIASATEIVSFLGMEDLLVGRSHGCDYPPSVQDLPVCTEAKFDTNGTSLQIDQRVKAILRDGLSVYRVFTEELRGLNPDVILTQAQCEVCAVSLKDVQAAVCDWVGHEANVVSLEPNELKDIWSDIEKVAVALDVEKRGRALVASLQRRVDDIAAQTRGAPHPSVAFIEWADPLMAGGNWIPELVALAGGRSLFAEGGKHSPWLEWDALLAADPDVIVLGSCGFNIARNEVDYELLRRNPQWDNLRAVQKDRVFILDGNQYFNRPGPRVVESLEILTEILHPELFGQGKHRGIGWVRAEVGAAFA